MKKSKIAVVAFLALALGIGASVAFAKSDNAKAQSNNGKSKADKTANLKNFKQPNIALGETNAKVHKEKTTEVVQALEQVAVQEETAGNTAVSNQVETVATVQEQTQTETVDAIDEVETRGKVKTFLVGTDYKNLGQLRSSLVHNRNEIRQLTRTLTLTQTPENKALIETQLATLMQERERIKTVITTNESSFSLFGWVSRFLANYEQTPINEEEETDLTEEVEEAIDNAETGATADTTTPTTETPVPTAPADTTTTTGTTTTTTTTTNPTDAPAAPAL